METRRMRISFTELNVKTICDKTLIHVDYVNMQDVLILVYKLNSIKIYNSTFSPLTTKNPAKTFLPRKGLIRASTIEFYVKPVIMSFATYANSSFTSDQKYSFVLVVQNFFN